MFSSERSFTNLQHRPYLLFCFLIPTEFAENAGKPMLCAERPHSLWPKRLDACHNMAIFVFRFIVSTEVHKHSGKFMPGR